MSDPIRKSRRRRRLAIGGCSLLGVLVLAVVAVWWIARGEVAAALDNAQQQARAQGYDFRHRGASFSGFPLQLEVSLDQPEVAWNGGKWRGPKAITGGAWLTDPFEVRLLGPGPHRVEFGPFRLQVDSRVAEALVEVGTKGAEALQLTLRDSDIVVLGESGRGDMAQLDLTAAPLPPLKNDQRVMAINLDLASLVLPPVAADQLVVLGPEIQSLSVRAGLSGPLPPIPKKEAVEVWRQGDGHLDLDRLSLRWGDLRIEASGRLQLDQVSRPAGILDLEVAGLPLLLQALAAQGKLDSGMARTYGSLLGGMARPRPNREGRWIALPLVLRDGRAFLRVPFADIPLARLPSLRQS